MTIDDIVRDLEASVEHGMLGSPNNWQLRTVVIAIVIDGGMVELGSKNQISFVLSNGRNTPLKRIIHPWQAYKNIAPERLTYIAKWFEMKPLTERTRTKFVGNGSPKVEAYRASIDAVLEDFYLGK